MPELPAQAFEGGLWCSDVLEALGDFAEGSLDATLRVAVNAHLAACGMCERFGGAYAHTVAALRAGLGSAQPHPLRGDIDRRLTARLARETEET